MGLGEKIMNRKDVEKFLELTKDQPFGIWMRNSNNEEYGFDIEVANEVELMEECLIIGEESKHADGKIERYWDIINLADIVRMNSNY